MYPHLTLTPEQTATFWAKVDKCTAEECWIWLGAQDNQGYGQFRGRGAHRVAWSLINGPIPDGLFICHRCDNPPCVNPNHLWADTAAANFRDMVQKGRADPYTLRRLCKKRKEIKKEEREQLLKRMAWVFLVIAAWEERDQRMRKKHRNQNFKRQVRQRQRRAEAKAAGLNDPVRELEILRLNGLL